MSQPPQYPSYPGSEEPATPPPAGDQPPPPPGYQPPPPPGGGPPPYGYPAAYLPTPPRQNGKSLAAMILGITSIVFCYVGLLIGPVAIVLAVLGKKEVQRSNGAQSGAGMATAGLATGIIGTLIWAAIITLIIIGGVATGWE